MTICFVKKQKDMCMVQADLKKGEVSKFICI